LKDSRVRQFCERRSGADVIRMEVRDDDAPDL
jgi:hypothetical protein